MRCVVLAVADVLMLLAWWWVAGEGWRRGGDE